MAFAAKARKPAIEMVGVQCAAFPQFANSWRAARGWPPSDVPTDVSKYSQARAADEELPVPADKSAIVMNFENVELTAIVGA